MSTLPFAEQTAWMHSMRPKTARIEFVFNNGDKRHPLIELLAHLDSVRTIGVGPGNGYYGLARPSVVKRSKLCQLIDSRSRLGIV